ncbi:hypothetical protein ACJ41O_015228 [Fusarium nematophilum]
MAGLQENIYVSTAITWVAAFVALIMRGFARRMTKMSWWYDDYFCVLAFVSSGLLLRTMHWSLGQYMPDSLDEETREEILYNSRRLGFFNSLTYAFSIACSKLAILFLYWRIFKHSAIRIPIQVLLVVSVMWIILRTFMVIFRCIPVQYYWDKNIDGSCKIKDTEFFFSTVLTHFLMDIVILILPVLEVSKLRLRLGQKLAVTGLFVLGFIVCLASIFALVEAIRYNPKSTQIPYDYALYCIWGSVEINIAVVSGKQPGSSTFPPRLLLTYRFSFSLLPSTPSDLPPHSTRTIPQLERQQPTDQRTESCHPTNYANENEQGKGGRRIELDASTGRSGTWSNARL